MHLIWYDFCCISQIRQFDKHFLWLRSFLGYVVELSAEMYFIEAEIKVQTHFSFEITQKLMKVTKLTEEASKTPIKRDNTPAQPEPTLKCWAFPSTQCAAQFG